MSEAKRKVFIKTFGCQMNEYDSARMADVLRVAGGYEPTEDPAEADLLLLNTCSVREKAQEKVFSLLGRWRELKALRPQVIIGVGGCVASQEGEGITQRAPFVDLELQPAVLGSFHAVPCMPAPLASRLGSRLHRIVGRNNISDPRVVIQVQSFFAR